MGSFPHDLPKCERVRDLLIYPVAPDRAIVVGCDALGAIGAKERDMVHVPAYIVGRYTARVALMEVMASGAVPAILVNTLCAEPDPTGFEVSRGISDELAEAGLSGQVAITGSSEKNMPTEQTGLGITVIGLASPGELRFGRSARGDHVVCVGIPKVGTEVHFGDPETVDISTVGLLLGLDGVREIVPAGSMGVLHEAKELAVFAGLRLEQTEGCGVDPLKTAGPATCLVASVEPSASATLGEALRKPVFQLGILR